MKTFFALIIAGLALSGCADTGTMNLGSHVVNGEQVLGITGNVKDASVQKEALFFKAHETRDKAYQKMYSQSGFNVKFEMIEVAPGVKVQVMKEVSFKESPRFEQPLPSGPSVHPVWRSFDNAIDKGANMFLWWTGITQGVDLLKNAQNKAAPQYYGNYNPQTAPPYIVQPEIVVVPQ